MSITDELRKWACDFAFVSDNPKFAKRVGELCDNIDAAHEKELAEQYNSLTVDMQPMTDENMAESGWVRLPVDADGVPIRVGDEVYYGDDPKDHYPTEFLTLYKDGWAVDHCMPVALHHWEAPTVEDMLTKMLEEAVGYSDAHTTVAYTTVSEYAKKLRETAMLERKTCHCTTPDDAWCFACSACGKSFPRSELSIAHNHGEINYCPNCGAKVVD